MKAILRPNENYPTPKRKLLYAQMKTNLPLN